MVRTSFVIHIYYIRFETHIEKQVYRKVNTRTRHTHLIKKSMRATSSSDALLFSTKKSTPPLLRRYGRKKDASVLRSSSSAASSTSVSVDKTDFTSNAFDAFQKRFSGRFGAVVREYVLDAEEKSWRELDIPLRYVHGVGVVPKSSMPFADKLYEANAQVTCRYAEEGAEGGATFSGSNDAHNGSVASLPRDGTKYCEIETKRSFPEVGEQESMGSCGGSEWNERTQYAEDRKYFLLRGASEGGEARTVDESGSFTAGPKMLFRSSSGSSSSDSTSSGSGKVEEKIEEVDHGMTWFPMHENESSVRFGLQWEENKRVRVDYHVKKNTGKVGCVIWSERKSVCAPRSDSGDEKKWSDEKKTILRERAFVLEEDKFTNVPPNSPSLAAISKESLLLFERSNPIALRCGEDFVYACSSLEHATGEKEETASPSTTCFAAAIDIGAGKTMLWTRVYDMGKFKFAHFAELAAAI